MIYDPEWGWLRLAVDPWAGGTPYEQDPFDWFCAEPCQRDYALVG